MLNSFIFQFLKKLLILLSIAILVDFLFIFLVYNSKYSIYWDWSKIVNGEINTDVIVNGSSRAQRHINPEIIESITGKTCFNIGLVSEPAYTQYKRFQLYLKNNRNPEYLIQIVDPTLIGKPDTLVYKSYYTPYIYEKEIYDALKYINTKVWKDKYIPLYKWHGNSELIYNTTMSYFYVTDTTFNGFIARNITWHSDTVLPIIRHTDKIIYTSMDTLASHIDSWVQNDIEVILLYSPMTYEGQSRFVQNEKIISHFDSLARVKNILFWNYSNHNINNDRTKFYNHLHLNAEGAKIFSEILAKRIKNELLVNQSL